MYTTMLILLRQREKFDFWPNGVEYFYELINNHIGMLVITLTEHDGKTLPQPSTEETIGVIHQHKNCKSPGTNGITVELIKYGGVQLH